MPCYDDRSSPSNQLSELSASYKELKDEYNKLQGVLCSVFTELNNMWYEDDFLEFIKTCEANGQINIYKFWQEHQQVDEERLKADLGNYSRHELEVIKKLLS